MKKIIPLILLALPFASIANPPLDEFYKDQIQEAEIVVLANFEKIEKEWKIYPIEVWRGEAGLIEDGFVYATTQEGKKYKEYKGQGIFFFPEDPHHSKLRNFIEIKEEGLKNMPETSVEELKALVVNE